MFCIKTSVIQQRSVAKNIDMQHQNSSLLHPKFVNYCFSSLLVYFMNNCSELSILEEIFLIKFYTSLLWCCFYKLWLPSDWLLLSSTLCTSVMEHSITGISDESWTEFICTSVAVHSSNGISGEVETWTELGSSLLLCIPVYLARSTHCFIDNQKHI